MRTSGEFESCGTVHWLDMDGLQESKIAVVAVRALPNYFEPAIESRLNPFIRCLMLRVDLPALVIGVETSECRFMHDVNLAHCPLGFACLDALKRLNDGLERGDVNAELPSTTVNPDGGRPTHIPAVLAGWIVSLLATDDSGRLSSIEP